MTTPTAKTKKTICELFYRLPPGLNSRRLVKHLDMDRMDRAVTREMNTQPLAHINPAVRRRAALRSLVRQSDTTLAASSAAVAGFA